MKEIKRRAFLRTTGAATIAAGTLTCRQLLPAVADAVDKNQRLRIGMIGMGTRGLGQQLQALGRLVGRGARIEVPAVCDVYSVSRARAVETTKQLMGSAPNAYVDYEEMLSDEKLDAVCVATPDHWHAKQTIDALKLGLHVYCEKPMTHTVQEALDVVAAWRRSGRVVQVGVQSTSLPIWKKVQGLLQEGKLGKVLMFQTEFFRNSAHGQWRKRPLELQMTPASIDWTRWLGTRYGLAQDVPFDREVFVQWRRFWPFGAGIYTDLFVHRTTSMLSALGLRFPGRVTGAGGIFLEYDGRDVPDVATVVADYHEGVQGLITATMCSCETPIRQLIRGHYGSFVFGNGEEFTGCDFVPERPQVTGDSSLKPQRIEAESIPNTTVAHFQNWLDAIEAGDPLACNNPPDLGAAAIITVKLGTRSYRQGKVFFFDTGTMSVCEADASWARKWEQMSHARRKPNHISGWTAGEYGSMLREPDYMKLAGPWVDGKPPTAGS